MPQPEHHLVALEWPARALEDWEDAQILGREQPTSGNVLWLVQQAIEKGLKSLLILHGLEFRKTHDLERLRRRLPEGYEIRKLKVNLSALTQRSMESRYPGDYEPITETDVQGALQVGLKFIQLYELEFDPLVRRGLDPETGQPYPSGDT